MDRKIVKRIFILTILYLILQYGVVGLAGYYHSEPWPAFVFPGFRSVLDFEEGFEISRYELYFIQAGGDTTVITPAELFYGIPDSQRPGFMRRRFGDDAEDLLFTAESREWIKGRVEHMTGYRPEQMVVRELRDYYSHRNNRAVRDSVGVKKKISFNLENGE
ncbi:MAG TPA: hypothetical protein VK040_07240 [Balneolaceae bacterium]|nr:hypothetical protein [Balneolaceae bacterium]